MINPGEWLKTRRKLLESVKAQVQARLGRPSVRLRAYARAIEADYRGPWRRAKPGDLDAALDGARIVLGADFHAYAQSQRALVRVLRARPANRPLILALECVAAEHDRTIARYLAGQMTEAKFLKAVRWDEDWGFPFAHYRAFFELCRDRGHRVVGLNTRGDDLVRRDRWTAARLDALAASDPDALVFAVIGEWHVAASHVPKRLKHPAVTLLQDIEPLYFRLSKATTPVPEVMRSGRERFCLMVSPPWMKWQSYLMYLEHAYDRELEENLGIDYSDHVASLVEVLEADLGVVTNKSKLQVYCPDSRQSLSRLSPRLPKARQSALLYHLEHDLSFFVPERDWLYLSRATINHASALAGQFLHGHLCRRQRSLWTQPADFLALIWIEAVGFFFSKWINPRRKADTLEGLRVELSARHPRDHGRRRPIAGARPTLERGRVDANGTRAPAQVQN